MGKTRATCAEADTTIYAIDNIIGARRKRGRVELLVKWAPTWEPADNVMDSGPYLRSFLDFVEVALGVEKGEEEPVHRRRLRKPLSDEEPDA